MKNWRLLFVVLITAITLAVVPSAVHAAEQNIWERQDTFIAESQTVENVVVVGGNATIQGVVRDSVVVVNGDLKLASSARIKGIVLVVGGKIYQDSGAQLTDNVLNLTFDQVTINGLLLGGVLLIGAWALRLVVSWLIIVLPVLISLLARHRLDSFEEFLRHSLRRTFLIGFAVSLAILALSALLTITIVGIPLVLVLLLISLVAILIGFTVISQVIGQWIPWGWGSNRPVWMTVLGGALLTAAVSNVPLFGGIFSLILVWVSFGMTTLWLWEKRNQRKTGKRSI